MTWEDIKKSNYKGYLPQTIKSEDLYDFFYDNYVNKGYVDEAFKDAFNNGDEYDVEISYYPVHRLTWDADVRWNTTSSSDSVQGDYIVTTTTTTHHSKQKRSGMRVSPECGDWYEKLAVEDFSDDDIYKLNSLQGLQLHWFHIDTGADYEAYPLPDKTLQKRAVKKARSEDKGKSVSITWADTLVLVPIFTVYRKSDNRTIFAMNLYNKKVAYDDVPLRPELEKSLGNYVRVAKILKLVMFLSLVINIIVRPIVFGGFSGWTVFFGIVAFILWIVFMVTSKSNREGTRERLIKKYPSVGFFKVQLAIFIMTIVYVVITFILGSIGL